MDLVAEVLRRLEEHGVVVKASKARLAMSQIDCLGFIIGRDGVKTASVLATPELLWRDGPAAAGDRETSQQGPEERRGQEVPPVNRMGQPNDAGVQ